MNPTKCKVFKDKDLIESHQTVLHKELWIAKSMCPEDDCD